VVTSGEDSSNFWTGQVGVHKYAKYGVGLYKVIGASTGPGACSGTGYVRVTGRNPLSAAAGAAAAGMTVVGVALVGASVASAALSSKGFPSPTDPIYLHDDSDDQRHALTHEDQWQKWERCLHAALPALFMTVAVMVSGMGAPGAPGALPR